MPIFKKVDGVWVFDADAPLNDEHCCGDPGCAGEASHGPWMRRNAPGWEEVPEGGASAEPGVAGAGSMAADLTELGDELASDGGDESVSSRQVDRDEAEWFGLDFGAAQQPNTLARIAAAAAPIEGGVGAAGENVKLELDGSSEAKEHGSAGLR